MKERNTEISCELETGGIDELFDEKPGGSSFLALRSLRWSERNDFKLDMRKWFTNSVGEEVPGKGINFITEDGPGNLVIALLKHGYGETKDIIRSISDREDIVPALIYGIKLNDVNSMVEIISGKYGNCGDPADSLDAYCKDHNLPLDGEEKYFDPKDIIGG